MTYTGAGGSNELSVSKAWLFTSSSRHVRVSAAHTRTVFLSGGGMGDTKRQYGILKGERKNVFLAGA